MTKTRILYIDADGWITSEPRSSSMPCDGRELDIREWPRHFEAIGYRHGGQGDTFRLPDFRLAL